MLSANKSVLTKIYIYMYILDFSQKKKKKRVGIKTVRGGGEPH